MAEADINEGQWCKYEDVKTLEEENEKLKRQLKETANCSNCANWDYEFGSYYCHIALEATGPHEYCKDWKSTKE
jgi:hypothetical protein